VVHLDGLRTRRVERDVAHRRDRQVGELPVDQGGTPPLVVHGHRVGTATDRDGPRGEALPTGQNRVQGRPDAQRLRLRTGVLSGVVTTGVAAGVSAAGVSAAGVPAGVPAAGVPAGVPAAGVTTGVAAARAATRGPAFAATGVAAGTAQAT